MVNKKSTKLFVLDTNVLLHDPTSLHQFKEHDLYIPFVTLEEMDNHKVGTQDINRNARQATRLLEQLVSKEGSLKDGYSLATEGQDSTGFLYIQSFLPKGVLKGKPVAKNDNGILQAMLEVSQSKEHSERDIILVSKDLNLRIKARALGFKAEDYLTDHTVEDADLLRVGAYTENGLLETVANLECTKSGSEVRYVFDNPEDFPYLVNDLLILDDKCFKIQSVVQGGSCTLVSFTNRQHAKNAVWGITARNVRQNYALDLLLNPDIDIVTILGAAGSGKTLLTLAAGLHQVMEKELYSDIIFTRATVPLGEDIGFLPGTEEDKMGAWAGALDDNFEVLLDTSHQDAWSASATKDLAKSKVHVKAMTFMRGRTLNRKFFIVDEAQNLTPKQIKTLITRCGPGTKLVCLGNLAQIDTPYLSETSNGLTYAVERFKGWKHFGHIILEESERSRLVAYANEVL